MKQELSAGILPYKRYKNKYKYLLLHYPRGHWGFPKGHVENGENPVETARRELKEETNLEIEKRHPNFKDKIDYYYSWDGEKRCKEVIFFAARVEDKEVTLSHEHQDYCWLESESIADKITYDNEKKLFNDWLEQK